MIDRMKQQYGITPPKVMSPQGKVNPEVIDQIRKQSVNNKPEMNQEAESNGETQDLLRKFLEERKGNEPSVI